MSQGRNTLGRHGSRIPDAELVPELYSLSGPVCVLDPGLQVSRAGSLPSAHVGVDIDREGGHASISLDLVERQSVPVVNLVPRLRRGVALRLHSRHSGVERLVKVPCYL